MIRERNLCLAVRWVDSVDVRSRCVCGWWIYIRSSNVLLLFLNRSLTNGTVLSIGSFWAWNFQFLILRRVVLRIMSVDGGIMFNISCFGTSLNESCPETIQTSFHGLNFSLNFFIHALSLLHAHLFILGFRCCCIATRKVVVGSTHMDRALCCCKVWDELEFWCLYLFLHWSLPSKPSNPVVTISNPPLSFHPASSQTNELT